MPLSPTNLLVLTFASLMQDGCCGTSHPVCFLGRVGVQRTWGRRPVSGKRKRTQGPPHRPSGPTDQNVFTEEHWCPPHPTPRLSPPPSECVYPNLFLTQIKSAGLNIWDLPLTHLQCRHHLGHTPRPALDVGQGKAVTGSVPRSSQLAVRLWAIPNFLKPRLPAVQWTCKPCSCVLVLRCRHHDTHRQFRNGHSGGRGTGVRSFPISGMLECEQTTEN